MAQHLTKSEPIKPPLKWAGGKRWLVSELQKSWKKHQHRRLVEPFCGGLAVSLGLRPERALVNDVNSALINFYQQIQQSLKVGIELLNEEAAYYENRRLFNQVNGVKGEEKLAAELFYYLNRTGYNGLCRFNKKGGFNVPFGRYKTINYQRDFSQYESVLAAWEFENQDFEKLSLEDDDFIYADPPYDTPFRQYSPLGFDWKDQERLAEWLSQHKGPVMISNQATDRVKKLYRKLGFKLKPIKGPRSISCKANGRKAVKEVLAVRGL